MGKLTLSDVRVITAEQYKNGYSVFLGLNVIPNMETRQYELIRKLPNDCYLVKEPSPKEQSHAK